MPRPIIALLSSALLWVAPLAAAQGPAPKATPTRAPQAKAASLAGKAPRVFQVDKPIDVKLSLKGLDGKVHVLEKYLGKTLIVDFWSVRCPVSIKYEPRMKALYARYEDDPNVVFLAIDSNHTELVEGPDPYARIRKYVADAKIPFPVLVDEGNVVADRFGAKTTPHVFVIDPKGVLRYAGGPDDDREGKKKPIEVINWAVEAVSAIQAGKPVAVKTTKPFGCAIKRVKKRKVSAGS